MKLNARLPEHRNKDTVPQSVTYRHLEGKRVCLMFQRSVLIAGTIGIRKGKNAIVEA